MVCRFARFTGGINEEVSDSPCCGSVTAADPECGARSEIRSTGPWGRQLVSKTSSCCDPTYGSAKKQIIAANMKLTDVQAEKFWPVYDAYAQETTKLGDARFALIKEYANQLRGHDGRSSRQPRQQNGNVGRANCDRARAVDSEVRGRCLRENRLRCSSNWTGASLC